MKNKPLKLYFIRCFLSGRKNIKIYNVPELITGEVVVSPQALRDKVLEDTLQARPDASVDTVYMKSHLPAPKK